MPPAVGMGLQVPGIEIWNVDSESCASQPDDEEYQGLIGTEDEEDGEEDDQGLEMAIVRTKGSRRSQLEEMDTVDAGVQHGEIVEKAIAVTEKAAEMKEADLIVQV